MSTGQGSAGEKVSRGSELPGGTLALPAGHWNPRSLSESQPPSPPCWSGPQRTNTSAPQCCRVLALPHGWVWKAVMGAARTCQGWHQARTQPEDKGTGCQQHVADVPEVGVQVVEQRPAGGADEAAVQAARPRTEQLEGLSPASPPRALGTHRVSATSGTHEAPS